MKNTKYNSEKSSNDWKISKKIFQRLELLCVATLLLNAGCATVPYKYGHNIENKKTLKLREGEKQVERGKPNVVIDSVGWVLGIPSKVILWNIKMDNHRISTNTEVALETYLATNELNNVKVRLNEYAPGGEWSRLFRNKSVGWGWRYTIGVISMAFYTILPGRLFGGDNYNPYSNTVNIYSDVPAVVLHEGGHSKDFARHKYKGTYAAFYILPFAALLHEGRATADAMGYLRVDGTAEEEAAAYKILYPAYATYIGGNLALLIQPGWAVYGGAVVGGHVVGRVKASGVEERREKELRLGAEQRDE